MSAGDSATHDREEFRPLVDEIFRDKVRWAQAEAPERKLVEGMTLFEEVVERMRGGIRAQYPHFTAEAVEGELYRRIARIREIEEHGLYEHVNA